MIFFACQASAADPAPDEAQGTIYSGLDLGSSSTRQFHVGGAWMKSGITIDGYAVHGEAEYPEGDAASTLLMARAMYDFGAFGLGLGARSGEVDKVQTTRGWFVGGFFDYDALRFSAEIETRDTRLDTAPFTVDRALFDGLPGTVSGESRCDNSSLGYSLRMDLARPRWSMFAYATSYDYDDFDCDVTVTATTGGGPPATPPGRGRGRGRGRADPPGRAVGRTVAVDTLTPAPGFSSRIDAREAQLLDSSLGLGGSMTLNDRFTTSVQLTFDAEQFTAGDYATLVGYLGVRLSPMWVSEFSLGYTDASVVEDVTFVGVRFIAEL